MMLPLLGIAVIAGGLALARKRSRSDSSAPGSTTNGVANMPPDVTGTPRQNRVTARTGREYMVTTWPPHPSSGIVFSLAVLASNAKYFVSYRQFPNGQRQFWQANAPTPAERLALCADFGLSDQQR